RAVLSRCCSWRRGHAAGTGVCTDVASPYPAAARQCAADAAGGAACAEALPAGSHGADGACATSSGGLPAPAAATSELAGGRLDAQESVVRSRNAAAVAGAGGGSAERVSVFMTPRPDRG